MLRDSLLFLHNVESIVVKIRIYDLLFVDNMTEFCQAAAANF